MKVVAANSLSHRVRLRHFGGLGEAAMSAAARGEKQKAQKWPRRDDK